jgi:uncharacterized protein
MGSWNPFHEGELRAQRCAGEVAEGESNGAMIGDKMMAGALNFIRAQKMVVLSSRDARGRRWASILFGESGFLEPNDRKTLTIAIDANENDPGDVLWENLKADEHVGVLIIEMETRRRLRVNGRGRSADGVLTVHVEESYANCPKYITRRAIDVGPRLEPGERDAAISGRTLGKGQIALLRATDVLFLASGHPERGADASHRGGNPGFVEVLNGNALRIPDYSGNSLFNTLGNFLVDEHFGMLVPDFGGRRMLQLTGTAKVNWADRDADNCSGGTARSVEFAVEEWRERVMAAREFTGAVEYSPYNPVCV